MGPRHRLLLIALLTTALLVFGLVSAPVSVANFVRVWLWWNARQQGLVFNVESISAPFLRPVVIRGLRLTSSPPAASRIDLTVTQAVIRLKLKPLFLRRKGRMIRDIRMDNVHLLLRHGRESRQLLNEAGWRALRKILPSAFNVQHGELRIEDRQTVVLLRNVLLSGSEIEAGSFSADQVMIASPWLRQTFAQLRGGTKWEENRLTIAGLSLTNGVDLASVTFDLAALADRAIGIHFDAEVFGGGIRADISHDWHSVGATWNVAGSASEISLAQLAAAIGFTDDVSGRLHACKFTLRGNLLDPLHATGWMWTELTQLKWRERALDLAMLGATFNNRQIAVQQLYLKQSGNEFTLAGEATLPTSFEDWMKLDVRADVSASIHDLENFARLCGAKRHAFGGDFTIAGGLKAHDRKLDGRLTVDGSDLTISHATIDLLRARLSVSGTQVNIEELELARRSDSLRAEGKIDISPEPTANGSLMFSIGNLADYVPDALPASALSGQLTFQNHSAAIDSLTLHSSSARIDFTGTANFTDLQMIGGTIIPTQPLFDASGLAAAECINGVQLLPVRKDTQLAPQIQNIAFKGSAFSGAWQLILTKDAGPDEFIRVCRESNGRILELMVGNDKNVEFGASVLQSFRCGDRKALSLSLSQQ
ncbi:MAG TPA: hypothetical protein VE758_09670 [Chthoniobacterales bacterium]|nr:hypothetical protein [Chthoniobacterales bacterium]